MMDNVDSNNTLFFPTLALACGAVTSYKQGSVAIESKQVFILWPVVMEMVDPDAGRKNVQKRKHETTIVEVVGATQWDSANLSTLLWLFIGQKYPRAVADVD